MSNRIYVHSLSVNKDAIDPNNHVSNVKYIEWMQDTAIAHSNELGYSYDRFKELGTVWLVKSHQIDYMRPILLNDEIEITTWISEIVKSKFTREYSFKRKGDKKVLAKAKTDWVYFDIEANRPCKQVHPEVLDSFQIAEQTI